MSQSVNEPIDPGGTIDSTKAGSSGAGVSSGAPGILFASQVRDQTGASGGSASGVYTTSEHYNRSARGLHAYLVISPTGAATGTVTFKVQVIDPVTATWVDLTGTSGGFPAVNGTGATGGVVFTVYPLGTTDSSSTGSTTGPVINQQLGPRWRGVATLANAALTFTVGADYLL